MDQETYRLEQEVRNICRDADLEDITIKDVRRRVEHSLGVHISDKATFGNIVRRVLSDTGVNVDQVEDDVDDDVPKKSARGGGLKTKKYILSDPLKNFMGVEMETRPHVVKKLWDYIKEKGLQDDLDKRRIHLDETLEGIFGIKTFTMFSMQKVLSRHLKKDDVDMTWDLDPGDEDYESIPKPDPEKRKRKLDKRGGRKIKKKRRPPGPDAKPNGFKKPVRVSDTLRDFMGQEMSSRGDVVKKLWEYIKARDLQNPTNRREIICDDTLRRLFDQDTVTSFSMNKYIQPHFLKDEPIME